jgi:hypothetical protein
VSAALGPPAVPSDGTGTSRILYRVEHARILRAEHGVTRFLPRLRAIYQVTLVDPDSVGHEELIRGTNTAGAQYVKGEGNLEKGLESLP